jgi:tetratricopeptide (TPR) repeat protein
VTRLLLALALVLLPPPVEAAPVSVRATLDPPQAPAGQPVELAVEVDGAQDAPVPQIADVAGLSVRYVGPSTEVSIVNGRISTSVTHRFSVVAAAPGTFTIGPITVDHGGRRHDAGTVTFRALAPGNAPAPQPGAPAAVAPATDQLRLVLSVPRREVYLRERLPVGVKLSIGNARVSDIQYPTLPGDGFALEKFPEPPETREHTPEGVFHVFDFRSTLTPLRSGTLRVGPARLGLNLRVRQRQQDPFFGAFFGESARPVALESEALDLIVLPLPESGRPPDFSGAVGQFSLEVRAAPLDLAAGDPVTVTARIRGAGNLEGVAPPALVATDVLRVYPVQAAAPGPAAKAGVERTFEQVVIPQRAGSVTLPPLRLSYFDPAARAYLTASHPPITLAVRPATRPEPGTGIVGGTAPAEPESLGRDIVFIKDDPGTLRATGSRLHRSAAFWVLQLLPPSVWIAAVLWDRRRRRLSGDVRYARFTRAGRQARRAIAGARDALRAGDPAAFYDAVARAVSEYLSAKLDLPPGSVTPESVGERLRATRLPPEVTHGVEEFFAACERARFAPAGGTDGDMHHTLARADAIVRALERERGLGRAVAVAPLLLVAASLAWAESPQAVFFRGNALYAEERYPEAAAAWEQVLAGGHESGNLYFNLGNAWFKQGDVGRAILNYERARRLIPRDPDLDANLGYGGERWREPVYARILFPLASRMSSDELLFAASVAYATLMLLLVVARLVPAVQRGAAAAAIAAGVGLAVLLGSAAWRLVTLDLPSWAVVIAAGDSTVRFEPSATGTAHFDAKPGDVLRLLAEREGWAQVARHDGRRGWIERDALAGL